MDARKTHETSLLNPKQYFENNFKNIFPYGTPFNRNDEEERDRRIREFVGAEIDEEKFRNLAAYCSPDRLKVKGDTDESKTTEVENMDLLKYSFKVEPVPQNTGLRTLDLLEKRIKFDPQYRYALNLKYRSVRNTSQEKTFKPVGPPDLIPGKEVLYRIRVYRPFMATVSQTHRNPLFAHDVIVLGSQTLDVLREAIRCGNEKTIRVEMSDHPDTVIPLSGKDVFKSGFFFVEDTFYNDHRDPDNIDYSECIREWASKRKMPEYKTAKMEEVTFNDLKFRLGHPQVYQHQGNCEHMFIFSDVRLLNLTDVCHSSFYPYQSIVAPCQSHYCMACRQFSAKWIVTESDRIMFDPAFFCTDCFKSFNYVDGKKEGNFKAYKFSSIADEI